MFGDFLRIVNHSFDDFAVLRRPAGPLGSAGLRSCLLGLLPGLLLVLTACGGGSKSPVPDTPAPAPPAITSVAVACSPATVAPGGTVQCTATVDGSGSYSSAVVWSSSKGSINQNGVLTAPSSAGSIGVTATSAADRTKSGQATITVQPPPAPPAPPPPPPPTPPPPPPPPPANHIVLVMEENKGYSNVAGNTTDWPNLNQLMANGALATNFFANTHPSIGNYFMLTTGQILTNNDNSTHVWNVDNLARRMLAAKVSFRIYAEGISRGYVGGNKKLYFVRHNPFALLSDLADNQQAAQDHIWPFSQFATDLANGQLPEFSYIVPDIDDDAHSGTSLAADAWLERNVVTELSNDPAFQPDGSGMLIVNFDEAADSDTRHGGGHIAVVFWGPLVKTDYRQASSTLYQQQSLLRTMMELLGLENPPGAAATAPAMSEFLVHPPQ